MIAAIRPDDVNLPLFIHVLGAMLLVGVLLTTALTLTMSAKSQGEASVGLKRFGLKAMLFAGLPAYLLMRIGAQWTEAQEDLPPQIEDQAWLVIGYITADAGALLVLVSTVLAAIGLRRLGSGGGSGQARAVAVISLILLAAYVIAVWAMSAKPA